MKSFPTAEVLIGAAAGFANHGASHETGVLGFFLSGVSGAALVAAFAILGLRLVMMYKTIK